VGVNCWKLKDVQPDFIGKGEVDSVCERKITVQSVGYIFM